MIARKKLPWLTLVALAGCGAGEAPPSAPLPVSAPAPVSASVPVPASAAAPAPAPPDPPPADGGPPLPPPAFKPPFERTARPGDGAWTPLVPGDKAGEPALIYRTTVHPHAIKGHVYVAIVAIDLRRVDLRLVAGTEEPLSKTVPKERRPGLVPPGDQRDLVAVMNGGFMARHGAWGMKVGADVLLPPKDDGCTIALYEDGSIRIRTFTELAATEPSMAAYRQTPPCLVEQGAVNPVLEGGEKPRRWGLAENGDVEVRRSALGLDEKGRTLFYGLGEWVTPGAMAAAMKLAGAVDAAQTDVNWSYTRFLLYRHPSPEGPPEVASTLIPKIKHATGEYVVKPATRDFFYLKRRR